MMWVYGLWRERLERQQIQKARSLTTVTSSPAIVSETCPYDFSFLSERCYEMAHKYLVTLIEGTMVGCVSQANTHDGQLLSG